MPLTLAPQGWWRQRIVVSAEVVTHAERHILRRQPAELEWRVDAGERVVDNRAGRCFPEIDITISKFEGDGAANSVPDAGVKSPREIPLARVRAVCVSEHRCIYIAEIGDRVSAEANTSAEKRCEPVPCPKINITVEHNG